MQLGYKVIHFQVLRFFLSALADDSARPTEKQNEKK
jgi:hypothetical protein